MVAPKLRFRDENGEVFGEWGKTLLGKACSVFKSGTSITSERISNVDKYPVFGGNGLRGYTNTYTHDGLFVLIGRQGALCGNINLSNGKSYISEHAIAVQANPKNCTMFLAHNLRRMQLNRLSESSAQPGLSVAKLIKLVIYLPTLPEQTKIANFLLAVDERIQQVSQTHALLTQYKKGVMQKIFSQELRFKDENGKAFGEWESITLEDILDYEQPTKYLVSSVDYSNDYQTPVLTAGKTFILGYTNELNGIYKKGLPTIIFDDFTTAFKYVDFPFKAKSSAMKMLKCKNDDYNLKFIFEIMSTLDFPLGDEHKRYWISEYSKQSILLPTLPEQIKIANFLSAIDDKINQAQSQLSALQNYKRGLLQQMFI